MDKYVCGSYIPAASVDEKKLSEINFNKITHTFIAFSVLERSGEYYIPCVSNEAGNGIVLIKNEIIKQKADTRVILSVGGAFADYFCPAVRTEDSRQAFINACAELINRYSLDGIDLDWEFPGLSHLGIMSCEHCVHDFTLLCKELKKAFPDKLITSAMGSDHWDRLENDELKNVLDYVCVMTYDMDDENHSSMPLTVNAMQGWANAGYDKSRLLLGVPFYSRCLNEKYNWTGYNTLIEKVNKGEAEILSEPCQDYIVTDGNRLSLDTPDSIRKKVDYIKKEQFGGIFCWQELTDYNGELRNAMFDNLM